MLRNRSGMALLLTLLTVSFLVAVTVRLSTSVNWQIQAAANQESIVQLDAMLLSGLHLAQAALLADQQENEYDSAFDQWGALDIKAVAELFQGTLDIQITDLSGRLQVNALVLSKEAKKKLKKEERASKKKKSGKGKLKKKDPEKMQREFLRRFLMLAAGLEDEEEAVAMIDSLADWLDEDEKERDNGAEIGYYSNLSPSYLPADRPIMLTEELLLVKNWEKKILYGIKKNHAEQDDTSPQVGIINYLTATGEDGKININTAPDLVLQALHKNMTAEFAAALIEFRQQEDNQEALKKSSWHTQVIDLQGKIEPELITVVSSSFKVKVTGSIRGIQRIGEGVIHRRKNQEQVLLYWKVE